jgi:dTDP-4-amino-4,6-dideoxygalactose transaminase
MSSSSLRVPLVDLVAQYQSVKSEMDKAIQSTLDIGQFVGGESVKNFAQQFGAYCNSPYCVPCANGTDAIEIALSSMGIGKGDEVIIPAFTFFATLEAVWNVGATPILCDIDRYRYTMDPYKAISLVTPATKVFMPVHLYGQMADMDPLVSYALDNNMFIIEDAAQAHGATYKGHRAGSIGDINTFSFYPAKNIGAYGDAGALTTKSKFLYEKALKMANHGRLTKYDHDSLGRNSRMDTIQAAILSVKLKHIEAWTIRRRELAANYWDLLGQVEQIKLPYQYADSPSVFHVYVIRVEKEVREEFRTYLESRGIETGIHYPVSLSRLKVTTDVMKIVADCPESVAASEEVVSLPLYPEMTADMQEYVCQQIISFFKK